MAVQMLLAFVAGTLSILSPCVLPLLPVVVTGALRQGRSAPVALALGLALSFTLSGLAIAALGVGAGLDGVIRPLAAGAMIVFGAVMTSSRLQEAFAVVAGHLGTAAADRLSTVPGTGVGGQFWVGVLLGAVWSPCIGPTLGAAVGLAAQSRELAQAALVMASFGLGGAAPVLALGVGTGHLAAARRQSVQRVAAWARPAAGITMALIGGLVITGLDKAVEAALTAASPAWLLRLTTLY